MTSRELRAAIKLFVGCALALWLSLYLMSCAPSKPLDPVVVILRDGMPVCSGFAVGRTQIVTAAHCVEPGQYSVAFATEPQWQHTARSYTIGHVQFRDEPRDIAAIEVGDDAEFLNPLLMRAPVEGERVTARSVMFGRLSSGVVLPSFGYFVDTTISIELGWSGSPVIGADGRVVGFVHACQTRADGARRACIEHSAIVGVMP